MTTAFGNRFRGERIRRKLHQVDAGRECGVTQPSVCHWERGEAVPEPKHFSAVAKFLRISEAELYVLIYQPEPNEPEGEPAPASPGEDELFTIPEVADMMRVASSTAKKLAKEGNLPGAFKIGGVWRIRKRPFLDWFRGEQAS